jgi:hypothetical protein
MFIHSDDGYHFLGHRKSSFGKVQMVYDSKGAERKIYDLETQNVPVGLLNSAITKSINSRRVLPTLLATLSALNISLKHTG